MYQTDPQTGAAHQSPSYRNMDPRRKSTFLATFWSLLPGLGQIYVGYYQRGFLFIIIVAMLVSLLSSGAVVFLTPALVFFLTFFWFFNLIDAHRRATFYNLALEGLESIELPDDNKLLDLGGSYLGGITLLVFGAIALSNTLFGLSLEWLEYWWPVAPLALGAWLVWKAWQDQKRTGSSAATHDEGAA